MKQTLDAIVNPFGDLKSGSPDKIGKVNAEADPALEQALKTYFSLSFPKAIDVLSGDLLQVMVDWILPLEKTILNPSQISLFLQILKKQATARQYSHEFTGMYLSKLIQDSYNAGHNHFFLNSGDSKIHNLICLKVSETNPLKLNIVGDAGSWLGYHSENCEYEIDGNVGEFCADESEKCKYTIKGNIYGDGAEFARDCVFELQGNNNFSLTMGSFGFGARGCKFITSNPAIAKLIIENIGEGSQLIYKK